MLVMHVSVDRVGIAAVNAIHKQQIGFYASGDSGFLFRQIGQKATDHFLDAFRHGAFPLVGQIVTAFASTE
jgi:hypothetical protein